MPLLTSLIAHYRSRRWLRWLVEVGLILGVLLVVEAFQTRSHPRGAVPDVALRALDGSPVRLASLAGRKTLLVVWAPWCGVCKLESSNVARVRKWLEPESQVVSIAAAYRSDEEVRSYVRENQIEYPVLLADAAFVRAFQVRAYPSFFVLDAQQRIVSSLQGYTTSGSLWLRTRLAGVW